MSSARKAHHRRKSPTRKGGLDFLDLGTEIKASWQSAKIIQRTNPFTGTVNDIVNKTVPDQKNSEYCFSKHRDYTKEIMRLEAERKKLQCDQRIKPFYTKFIAIVMKYNVSFSKLKNALLEEAPKIFHESIKKKSVLSRAVSNYLEASVSSFPNVKKTLDEWSNIRDALLILRKNKYVISVLDKQIDPQKGATDEELLLKKTFDEAYREAASDANAIVNGGVDGEESPGEVPQFEEKELSIEEKKEINKRQKLEELRANYQNYTKEMLDKFNKDYAKIMTDMSPSEIMRIPVLSELENMKNKNKWTEATVVESQFLHPYKVEYGVKTSKGLTPYSVALRLVTMSVQIKPGTVSDSIKLTIKPRDQNEMEIGGKHEIVIENGRAKYINTDQPVPPYINNLFVNQDLVGQAYGGKSKQRSHSKTKRHRSRSRSKK